MEGESSMVVVSETIAALRSNHFDALYVKSGRQALQKILECIPSKASVGAGDSLTLKQIGVFEELERRGYQLFWPFHESVPKSRRTDVARKALLADIFLTGSNAVTMDGKIVNVDSSGNRVAGMIFGPKKVIIVVGVNKIVENVEKAFERIRNVAAPLNAERIWAERGWELLPCVETGTCVDCNAENRICNITVIIEKKPRAIDATVVIVGEKLGL
jgi:L-lactate utilization protein LutC